VFYLNLGVPNKLNFLLKTLKSNQAHLGLLKLLAIHGSNEITRESSLIPILSDNLFQGLYIKRLELVGCGISVIQKGTFRGLESVLQEILITGNRVILIYLNLITYY